MIAALTLGSALCASGADLAQKWAKGQSDRQSLGASGVVMGIGTAAAAVSRKF